MRLVYSSDDDGYYWERSDWATSQIFESEELARLALKNGTIVWSK